MLIGKDLRIDWRQNSAFSGVILYLVTSFFVAYLTLKGIMEIHVWSGVFWIILLFTAFHGISRSFTQENSRAMYYFFTCKPLEIISAKLIYSFLSLIVLATISLIIYITLMGNMIHNFPLFFSNLALGCLGFSSAFTLTSAISFRTGKHLSIMSVIGLPIIIPVLALSVHNSNKILNGYVFSQLDGNLVSLLSVDIIIIVLTFTLFPFVWKS